MRTTLKIDPDVWEAVLVLRKELDLGVGEAVNWLARQGFPAMEAEVAKVKATRPHKFPY